MAASHQEGHPVLAREQGRELLRGVLLALCGERDGELAPGQLEELLALLLHGLFRRPRGLSYLQQLSVAHAAEVLGDACCGEPPGLPHCDDADSHGLRRSTSSPLHSRPAVLLASSATVPRSSSSWSLVSSRAMTRRCSGRTSAAMSRVSAMRCGDSKHTTVSFRSESDLRAERRWTFPLGRKPAK